MTIAIIVAMKSEFDLVRHIIKNEEELTLGKSLCIKGNIENKDIILLQSGIGKVNAGILTSELINKFSPDYIINSGVAGGIGKGIHQGDVVVGSECLYHDVWCGEGEWGQVQGLPLKFPADAHLLETAGSIANDKIKVGLICTGDQFISELEGLNVIKQRFPEGLAVDMESAAIAHSCYLKDTSFMSIRVISDTPGMEEDNTGQYFDFFKDAPQMTFNVVSELISKL